MEDEPDSPAELAGEIIDADRPSKPIEQRLRLQWNVPQGVTPYIPFWLSMLFVVLVVVAVVDALVH